MYFVKGVIFITLGLKIITAYPPLGKENSENLGNIDDNFERNTTKVLVPRDFSKDFNTEVNKKTCEYDCNKNVPQTISEVAFNNKLNNTNNGINNVIKEIQNNYEKSGLTDFTTVVNYEVSEPTTTVVNYGSNENTSITTVFSGNNGEKHNINNITKHTIVVNYEVLETTIAVTYSNKLSNPTPNETNDIKKNLANNSAENYNIYNFTEHTTVVNYSTTTKLEHNKEKGIEKNIIHNAVNNATTPIPVDKNEERSMMNNITELTTVVNNATTTKLDHSNDDKKEGDGLNTGQTIHLEQSKSGDDGEINSVGVKILRNLTTTCGYYLGKRVSFGRPTTLLQYPWTALLLYNSNERYHCGGSLITWKYVLTAAHCVAQEFYELSGVRLGEHDITTKEDCAEDVGGDFICSETIDVSVVKIIIHHEYSHLSHKNDIALLKLEQAVGISRSYYPICLPKPDENVLEKITGTVAGWGATEKSIRSNVLMEADVPILDMSKCREVYRYTKFNDSTEMCGSGVNEIDVCNGDSGGAIFYRNSGGRGKEQFFQMGIISLGVRRCGDSRFFPAVFTKLPAYIKWIENNVEN